MNNPQHSHVAVCQPPELLHTKRLLLDVVLSEEPRLASYHLLDRSINYQIIYVVVGATGLPAFRWNDLKKKKKKRNKEQNTNTHTRESGRIFVKAIKLKIVVSYSWGKKKRLLPLRVQHGVHLETPYKPGTG